ncbi:MAG: alpha-amylase family glycosyl hydrolase [Parvibaculaceae bacterium]
MPREQITGRPWWQSAVIYQIYPRSFQDSNGDGIGDLNGIIARADYLQWLGIDAVWISPIFPSPMADFGYDISDYAGIDPLFGTLADFDQLVGALHARNIRMILDFVPNHTSIEHPWFKESRRSRDNPKRDWYIWRDPAPDGGPPNNWLSQAGGIAWTFDETTGQYYYHAFLASQPDLNWRNPEVREAMHNVLRFWLDRGVDGFRVDVLWHLAKDPQFQDDPVNPNYRDSEPPFMRVLPQYSADHADMIEIATGMRRVLDEYPGDRVFIGELSLPLDRLMAYYGPELTAVHLPFNFALLWAAWKREGWTVERVRQVIARYEDALPPGAWPNWVLGNHDQPRIATRLGQAQARLAMVLLLTLRGTPTLYYGDELGHPSIDIPPDRIRDPFGINMPGGTQGRDPVRTPMPWDGSPNAGFTSGEPWLPLAPDAAELSVASEKKDPDSMLTLTRALIELRRAEPALSTGDWALIPVINVLAFTRKSAGRQFIIVLELESRAAEVDLGMNATGRVALSTHAGRKGQTIGRRFALRPDEALVIETTG